MINDGHIHFFSPGFYAGLGADENAIAALGWEYPESVDALAARWVEELDSNGVHRAALIASLPGDVDSVAKAVAMNASRFVGFFMLDPTREDAIAHAERALDEGLRTICLFPAMHRYPLSDERVARVFAVAAGRRGGTVEPVAVFVHCGVLSVGVRKKLQLPSAFEMRFGNPLDLHGHALKHPNVSIIIPHFGAGMLREALMLADCCPNVVSRHVELERVDQIHARLDARAGLQDRAGRRRPRSSDLRDRLVILPARLERRSLRAAESGA